MSDRLTQHFSNQSAEEPNFGIIFVSVTYANILLWVKIQPPHKLRSFRGEEVPLATPSHQGDEGPGSKVKC